MPCSADLWVYDVNLGMNVVMNTCACECGESHAVQAAVRLRSFGATGEAEEIAAPMCSVSAAPIGVAGVLS